MKNNLLKKIFSSGLQAIGVQVLGLLFFYIVSKAMSKNDFGIINWATAASVIITTLLSFGMEQVVFRRIAASQRSDWAAAAYMLHALVGSVIGFIVLFILAAFVKKAEIGYLPYFFLSQAFIYMATPLKQLLNAKQRFTPYGIVALISNGLKVVMAWWYISSGSIGIAQVYITLIICGAVEFFSLFYYVKKHAGFTINFRTSAYTKLLKESLPQYISVIFDSSLSRLDWFLIGIIGTNTMTADYGVAYKAFEMQRLPVTIIAPVILAKFAKLMGGNATLDEGKKSVISSIFRLDFFLAGLIPLISVMLWVPALEFIYDGKYGADNLTEFTILSANIPLLFAVNLLWTISFTGKSYRKIANITIGSAALNLVLNLVLIPFYGGVGAASAFLLTTIIQLAGYLRLIKKEFFALPVQAVVLCLLVGVAAYFLAKTITDTWWLQLMIAPAIYIAGSVLLRQVSMNDVKTLKQFFK